MFQQNCGEEECDDDQRGRNEIDERIEWNTDFQYSTEIYLGPRGEDGEDEEDDAVYSDLEDNVGGAPGEWWAIVSYDAGVWRKRTVSGGEARAGGGGL